jgi:nuclear transport factor 2 (NTF2) superfamily protein
MLYESMPQFDNFAVSLWREKVQFDSKNPDVGFNRHLSKGAPTCLSEPKRSIHHLPSVFHTIKSDGCPVMMKEDEQLFEGKIAVPYVKQPEDSWQMETTHVLDDGDTVTFAYVSKSEWRNMVSKRSMTIENHNKFLKLKAVGEMTLRVGKLDPKKKGGIRVSVASRGELQPFVENHRRWVRDKGLEDLYTCQSFTEPNESGPGDVVIRFTLQRQVSCASLNYNLHATQFILAPFLPLLCQGSGSAYINSAVSLEDIQESLWGPSCYQLLWYEHVCCTSRCRYRIH